MMQSKACSKSIYVAANSYLKYQEATDPNSASLFFPEETVSAKEQLAHVAKQLKAVVNGENNTKSYTILDSDGKMHQEHLPSDTPYKIEYKSILQRHMRLDHEIYKEDAGAGPSVRSIAYINYGVLPQSDPEELDRLAELRNRLDELDKQWEDSKAAKAITEFLADHGKYMKTVTKVVGIGLGNPGQKLLAKRVESSYFQHLTLCHIAREISKVQENDNVKIFVQDPNYTELSRNVIIDVSSLDKYYNIQIVDDPDGFLMMDDQTIVFHCHLLFDIADIALDVSGEHKLAGLFGAKIGQDHQKEIEGKILDSDTTMWQLGKMNSSKKCNWARSCKELIMEPTEENETWYGEGTHFYIRLRQS